MNEVNFFNTVGQLVKTISSVNSDKLIINIESLATGV